VRAAFKYLVGLFFVGVVAQVGLAGVGAFHTVSKNDDGPLAKQKAGDWFGAHAAVGYLLVLLSLLILIVALAARDGRLRRGAGLLFGLMIVQVLLAWLGGGVWALGFLHPINALAIFALSGMLAAAEWRPAHNQSG
jgi:Family of unknown function (DUF6220)